AIAGHKASEMYQTAYDAEQYDRQENVTILQYQKYLYTLSGLAVNDKWSPNHKICSNFFNRFVTQENQYLLGNGVNMNEDNKEKLGKNFDYKLQQMGRNALVDGLAFGFWNLDHLETFKLTEFVPLFDEEDGSLKAGIRFYQIDASKPFRATLFEVDGYTDYIRRADDDMRGLNPKRPYQIISVRSDADGVEVVDGLNYPGFPIIPMYGNPNRQSELVGLRGSIDAYDLIQSGFANDMDGAHLYWILKNSGGMDDEDVAKFLDRINVLNVAQVEDAEEATPHEIPIPYESRVAYLDKLEQTMYQDFQALNIKDISASSKTATEIQAAYQPFDNKVDAYEYQVLDFLDGLFAIVGIEDEPSFTRSKVVSRSDDVQTLLMGAEYLDRDYVTKKICDILGDPDAAQENIDNRDNEDAERFGLTDNG
ncbi:MAG: phage portal protein, partial [Bacteroidales bacterium]|nr:phage portal protein [Bacteroidales bacterium]